MKKSLITLLGLSTLSLSITGCAVMSAEECRQENWYERGYQNGSNFTEEDLEPYIDACKSSKPVDVAGYNTGRNNAINAKCMNTNWQDKGYQDALQFLNQTDIALYRQYCNASSYHVNENLYSKGISLAAKEVCTSEKGYELGQTLASDNNVCRGTKKASNFYKYYKRGLTYGKTSQELAKLEQLLSEYDAASQDQVTTNLSRALRANKQILENAYYSYESTFENVKQYGYNKDLAFTPIYDSTVQSLPYKHILKLVSDAKMLRDAYNETRNSLENEIDDIHENLEVYRNKASFAKDKGERERARHDAEKATKKLECLTRNKKKLTQDVTRRLNYLHGSESSVYYSDIKYNYRCH